MLYLASEIRRPPPQQFKFEILNEHHRYWTNVLGDTAGSYKASAAEWRGKLDEEAAMNQRLAERGFPLLRSNLPQPVGEIDIPEPAPAAITLPPSEPAPAVRPSQTNAILPPEAAEKHPSSPYGSLGVMAGLGAILGLFVWMLRRR